MHCLLLSMVFLKSQWLCLLVFLLYHASFPAFMKCLWLICTPSLFIECNSISLASSLSRNNVMCPIVPVALSLYLVVYHVLLFMHCLGLVFCDTTCFCVWYCLHFHLSVFVHMSFCEMHQHMPLSKHLPSCQSHCHAVVGFLPLLHHHVDTAP